MSLPKANLVLLFKVVTLYAGTIIGAGFASGQEIMQFFIVFGQGGLWGVLLATGLFVYLGVVIMALATGLSMASYDVMLDYLLGKKLGKVMDFLNLLMLPGGLVVMLAGSGAVFAQQLGLPHLLGTVLAAAVTSLVILGGLPGVLTANLILVPVKICALALVCLSGFFHEGGLAREFPAPLPGQKAAGTWEWAAILYVSYNIIVPVAVLSSLGRVVPASVGIAGGALGGLVLGATAGLITLAGLAFYPEIGNYEIPLLFIARHLGFVLQSFLGLLIWVAILTTAIADAHGLASRLAPEGGRRYKIIGVSVTLAAIPFAGLDFSLLVKILYPLFGYAGLVLLFALLAAPGKKWFIRCLQKISPGRPKKI
ncbi:MAG: hypothetical protein AB1523_02530 [Bacillota bacterium]